MNPNCHFPLDEFGGPFSPVHAYGVIYKTMQFGEKLNSFTCLLFQQIIRVLPSYMTGIYFDLSEI